jgi:hypothetical protein
LEVRIIFRTLAVTALCAGFASAASAVTLSGVGTTNSSTVSATGGGGAGDRAAVQGLQTLGTTPVSIATRFWATGAADRAVALSGGTANATVNMNYTITFSATAFAGNAYSITVNTSLLGALSAVDDAAGLGAGGSSSAAVVNGSRTGPGSLSGSLSLSPAQSIGGTSSSTNTVVNRNGSATISAVGTGAAQIFTLTFTVQFVATSPQSVGNGDEHAFRFGLSTATGGPLSGASADDYAGLGGRNGLNDGHFVTITAVPEPGTLLGVGLGLALLGLRRRIAA